MTDVIGGLQRAPYHRRMTAISLSTLAGRELGTLVSDNARIAPVLERFGLDYCCNGHQTLEEAARERRVPIDEVLQAISAAGEPTAEEREAAEWRDLGALTQHIVDHHHRYVREISPTLQAWLDKLVDRHGSRHAELEQVRLTFLDVVDEMASHMVKEENILFPFIRELAAAKAAGARLPSGPFGTVLHPVRVMEADHQVVGDLVARLRTLTNGYQPPDDGCTTYRLCYAELARFEADLHRHVHLENNVLFPGAVEIEQGLV
jgi:regulator of cell morphogenesis and NO signaling